ncbi:MAG: ATP-binding protein [Cyanobacteria bacterium P01_G01_bin.54]
MGIFFAVGISVSGTLLGLWIGDRQQRYAQQQLDWVNQQEVLLQELDIHILRIRSHPQRLVAAIENPLWFRYEVGQFDLEVEMIQHLCNDLRGFMKDYRADYEPEDSLSRETVEQVVQGYEEILEDYVTRFQQLWPQIDPLKLNPEGRVAAQEQVLTAVLEQEGRQLDIEFETLAGHLETLRQESAELREQAAHRLTQSIRLRSQIILSSISTAVIITVLMSLYTAQAIAKPLETVTQIAQQVTDDSDYRRQVPVTSQDEVGVLAQAFNQLIRQVHQQLQQLQEARDSLEARVIERTQALETTLKTLQETQGQLIHTEKMSSLGEMVAGIAHEINNPVGFIYGNVSHAQDYLQELLQLIELYEQQYPQPTPIIADYYEDADIDYLKEDFPSLFESMMTGTQRIDEIVKSLRNFSRLDEAEVKDVDLHEGLDSTLVILGSKIKQGVEIIKDYGEIPLIYCYPSQLNQVFLNLVSNAIDALMTIEMQPRQITISTTSINNNHIQVRIKDNGPGIHSEVKAKIFNPFFTTKPIGQGTGLGLSISYRIIEKHQGRIEVVSELGQGTEFRITLPICATALTPLVT